VAVREGLLLAETLVVHVLLPVTGGLGVLLPVNDGLAVLLLVNDAETDGVAVLEGVVVWDGLLLEVVLCVQLPVGVLLAVCLGVRDCDAVCDGLEVFDAVMDRVTEGVRVPVGVDVLVLVTDADLVCDWLDEGVELVDGDGVGVQLATAAVYLYSQLPTTYWYGGVHECQVPPAVKSRSSKYSKCSIRPLRNPPATSNYGCDLPVLGKPPGAMHPPMWFGDHPSGQANVVMGVVVEMQLKASMATDPFGHVNAVGE
jgi:hypothetical protein